LVWCHAAGRGGRQAAGRRADAGRAQRPTAVRGGTSGAGRRGSGAAATSAGHHPALLGQRLPDCPGRFAGLVVEWSPGPAAAGWLGRVVYVVDGDNAGRAVLVEAWVAAEHLTPASG